LSVVRKAKGKKANTSRRKKTTIKCLYII